MFINSKWSYSLNGLYQVAPDHPWGFNLAANLTGRQGYPIRYVDAHQPRDDRRQRRQRHRRPGRLLAGRLPLSGHPRRRTCGSRRSSRFRDVGLNLGVDVFNALNESYVLQRQGVLGRNNSGTCSRC